MSRINWKAALSRGGLTLIVMFGVMIVALVVADTAIRHPTESAALKDWFYASRYGWLAWRVAIYILLGWGIRKIRHAPGFREEYRKPLNRMTIVSLAFICICEYALFSQTGSSS